MSLPSGWDASAKAWIVSQGDLGDASRRLILDPCLDAILLDRVAGKSVLDVGCGEGRYCRKLALNGADVTGLDPTEEFIKRARQLHPEANYCQGFAESLPFPDHEFHFVLSYLSLVDIPDYKRAIREMCRVLQPHGSLLLVTISNIASTTDRWVKDSEGNRLYRTVDRYMEEFPIEVEWAGIRVTNFHRPLSAILGQVFDQGLVMDAFHEPLPDPSSVEYEAEFRVPTFQVIRFRKAG